jgi:hypothetical protein
MYGEKEDTQKEKEDILKKSRVKYFFSPLNISNFMFSPFKKFF